MRACRRLARTGRRARAPPDRLADRPDRFGRKEEGTTLAGTNRGVVYTGPGNVEVQSLDYPKLELPE